MDKILTGVVVALIANYLLKGSGAASGASTANPLAQPLNNALKTLSNALATAQKQAQAASKSSGGGGGSPGGGGAGKGQPGAAPNPNPLSWLKGVLSKDSPEQTQSSGISGITIDPQNTAGDGSFLDSLFRPFTPDNPDTVSTGIGSGTYDLSGTDGSLAGIGGGLQDYTLPSDFLTGSGATYTEGGSQIPGGGDLFGTNNGDLTPFQQQAYDSSAFWALSEYGAGSPSPDMDYLGGGGDYSGDY